VEKGREESRHGERLRLRVDRDEAGEVRADRDEADVPERDDARVADEHVERDHDGRHHHRVLELELALLRELGGDRGGRDEQEHGPGELHGRPKCAPHTRSTCRTRSGAKRPAGRSTSTAMTTPYTTDGR